MQNTLMGYNQELAVEYGLDVIDLAILQWFVRFNDKEFMNEEGKVFYWLNDQTLINDLPTLGVKSKDRIYRRLKKMEKCGLLIHKNVKQKGEFKGNFSFYAFGEKYPSFVVSEDNLEQTPTKVETAPVQEPAKEEKKVVSLSSKKNDTGKSKAKSSKKNDTGKSNAEKGKFFGGYSHGFNYTQLEELETQYVANQLGAMHQGEISAKAKELLSKVHIDEEPSEWLGVNQLKI